MAFLHKDLSLEEKRKIEDDVKNIVDSFGKVLSSIGDLPEEGAIERDVSFREEISDFDCDLDFRKRMFENAPQKNKDFIIAEKKKW